MKKLLLYFFLVFVSFANAQFNPQIFTDLYGGSDPFRGVNNLYFGTQMNNLLFFNLRDDDDNYKLYVTDGTVGNTLILKTVTQVLNFGVFDNHVYFSYVDPVNGVELWKTDGTVSGTVLVTTLGGNATAATYYQVVGNKLFFASGNAASPFQKQIYALDPGSNTPLLLSANLYDVDGITVYNGKVVFTASDTPTDSYLHREPYTTDGTTAGTTIIKDIKPGTEGSSPGGYFLYENKLYFAADDGSHGTEVWYTDGTESGTQLLKDINPGSANALFSFNPGITDGILFFAANDGTNGNEIWFSYGTAANTSLLIDINPTGDANPSGFVTLDTTLFFTANDGTHGFELWKTNGTAQFTSLVKDINPGLDSGVYGIYKSNALCPNILFFDADNGNNNIEPWFTDGTTSNTQMIADLNPTGGSLDYETRYVLFNDKIYFAAATGSGHELFVMDPNCSLGVETNQSSAFTIYPNPTKNLININTTAEIETIDIYNALGQLVKTVLGAKKEVDVSGFSNGIYLLTITTIDNLQIIKRIIKE